MDMTDRIVINQDIKIQYRVRYGKDNSSIILLHGGGGSLTAWDFILSFFSKFKGILITVDLRGHGLSGKPRFAKDYKFEKHSEDIVKIIKAEKLNKVILIGHCLGSMIAATYAGLYPSKLEKLVLINTGFELPGIFLKNPLFPVVPLIAKFIALCNIKEKGKRADYSHYVNTPDIHIGRLWNDCKNMGIVSSARQILGLLFWDGKKYFSHITVPTLIIGGKYDSFYPPAVTEEIGKLIKNSKIEYIDSNHISVINQPREVYQKIEEYLKFS